MDLLKMYSLLNMGIFHCHVSLLQGSHRENIDFKLNVFEVDFGGSFD